MRECPKCKKNIENDKAKFCKYCGAELEPVKKEVEVKPKPQPRPQPNVDGGIILGDISPLNPATVANESSLDKNVYPVEPDASYEPPQKNGKKMNMFRAVISCFRQYSTFSGCATRAEYWYFVLFNFICTLIPVIVAATQRKDDDALLWLCIAVLYSLISFVPGLAAGVRRLHDTGKSGAFYFICFIPVIGAMFLLCFLCKKTNEGRNIYAEIY